MSDAPHIAAIVPMRHASERVPGKNYRPFRGRPLYQWIIETLLACRQVVEVVIDTDSTTIMDDARRCFPSVRLVERPLHLRDGAIPMNDVLLHTVERVPADIYVQTHSTNPLLRSATIDAAISGFLTARPGHDSMFTVTRVQKRLWDAQGRPMNHDPAALLRTQNLPPVFEENSCLYAFDGVTLRERRNRLGARPLMLEIEALEAWDIDDELGFIIGEQLATPR